MSTAIQEIIGRQNDFFLSGGTRSIEFRKTQLKKLRKILLANEQAIAEAVFKDFHKSYFEVRVNELGLVYAELSKVLRKIDKWSKPFRPPTGLVNLPGQSRVYPLPFGTVLIIGPWNFPVQLLLLPLVSALAAGNTAVLKPSEISSHTSSLLVKLLNENFPPEYIYAMEGGVEETTEILKQRFDKIFFTGSTNVGRIVMKAAAEHLTPVTLELGGKNPTIVLPDCKLSITAKRIVWGKFYNGGQACVVPDHIYVHESIHDKFVDEVKKNIRKMLGEDASRSEALPRIINERNYDRLMSIMDAEKVVMGGKGDKATRYIEPSVLVDVKKEDAIMQDEIFGPLLPILKFNDLEKLLADLKKDPSPLSFYIFTRNIRLAREVQKTFRSGGGIINDTVIHFVNDTTPFGGIGDSGMGSYHGKAGFECFSHRKTVLKKPTWFELWVKYPPFTKGKLKIIKMILR